MKESQPKLECTQGRQYCFHCTCFWRCSPVHPACCHHPCHRAGMSFRRVAASLLPRIVRSASADVQPASRAAVVLAANWAGQPAFSPAASAALIRNFSSTAASFNSLSGVLRNELEYERQNYSQPEVRPAPLQLPAAHRRRPPLSPSSPFPPAGACHRPSPALHAD